MMHYRHEYISDELNDILTTMLGSDFCNSVCEEYHFIKAIDNCSHELSVIILNQYKQLTLIQRTNETYFNSGWYIKSNLENNLSIEDTLLTKTPTNHQIRFSFQKMRNNVDMQNIPRYVPYSDDEIEKLRKEIFSENLKTDNPVILILPNFMDNVLKSGNTGKDILEGMLAHELRHVVEQYILETLNTLLSAKNSLNSDFKSNNIFDLDTDSKEYDKLRNLMYCISLEEQRGRILAVYNLCKSVVWDNAFYSQMTASYNKVLMLRVSNQIQGMDENFRTEIVCVLRSNPFKYVHNLNIFRRLVNELILIKRSDIRKLLLIAGYFLYRHNYIKSKNVGLSGNELSSFFSLENVKANLNELMNVDDEHLMLIYRVIYKNYQKYENIIYNIIGMNIEDIFRYKSQTDNKIATFQKMAADSDLELKDYEVGLINESFNQYNDVFQKWLKGKPFFC